MTLLKFLDMKPVVGKTCNKKLEKLYIGQKAVAWNDNVKYLGLNFSSGPSLVLDHKHLIHRFYAAANAVCGHVNLLRKYIIYVIETSVLFSLETFCFAIVKLL